MLVATARNKHFLFMEIKSSCVKIGFLDPKKIINYFKCLVLLYCCIYSVVNTENITEHIFMDELILYFLFFMK